jgi:hypothetical protein
MIAYASRTGTRRNLDGLRAAGWRLLVSPGNERTEGFPYALDNGAWPAFQRGGDLDELAFGSAVDRLGEGADFVVAPDVVAGGPRSLELTLGWLPRLAGLRVLVAVQDGFAEADVAPLLDARVGVFVGGTTEYKLATMREWARVAHERGGRCHVGRVNTRRRIRLCQDARVDSFDGTSASRYALTLPLLDDAIRQGHLFGGSIAV